MAKELVKALLRPVPDEIYLRARFFARHGHWPDLKRPRSLSELIVSRMLHARDPLMALTADKHLVREYVRDRAGERYLAEMYAVSQSVDESLFSALPSSFVMKGTHGSKMVRLVPDKSALTADALDVEGRNWLRSEYSRAAREWVYRDLEPKLIFEELLSAPGETAPADYKFYVFNGRVRLVHVDSDRFERHTRTLYDRDWNHLAVRLKLPLGQEVAKPENFGEMREVAEALGAEFEFARVDLYSVGERIVFGEITHFPGSGNERFSPAQFDRDLLSAA